MLWYVYLCFIYIAFFYKNWKQFLYIIVYWLFTALWCPVDGEFLAARTDPVWTRAFCASRFIPPVLIVAALRKLFDCGGLECDSVDKLGSSQTTKFVRQTSSGPLFSSGIGWIRKCSSMSKILGNHKCCTRQFPSGLSDSRRCYKKDTYFRRQTRSKKNIIYKKFSRWQKCL